MPTGKAIMGSTIVVVVVAIIAIVVAVVVNSHPDIIIRPRRRDRGGITTPWSNHRLFLGRLYLIIMTRVRFLAVLSTRQVIS
jgi:hypothetical protein